MSYTSDERIVMTLDAGGTNFVFTAVQGEKEIVAPIALPAYGENLKAVLKTVMEGFNKVMARLETDPVAISFSFPGPTEYEQGIIGDLENLPSFRGGVALGPMLEDKFGIPVFINNDGDLFTLGEAIAGFLPWMNSLLKKSRSPKRYNNLFGATFGTGFGGGIVRRGEHFRGDNSAAGEINRTRNKILSNCSVEETISIRGIKHIYCREAGIDAGECPSPKNIFEIGMGERDGDRESAKKAFTEFGIVAGDALANAITLIDGLIVIGGGLSGAAPLFMPALVSEMNRKYQTLAGGSLNRLEVKVFNLEDECSLEDFVLGNIREIKVPFSERKIRYDPLKRIGVGISRLGTVRAVSIGAYAFALNQLNKAVK
jgi:glucokinase